MEISYSHQETAKLIEEYYKVLECRDVKVDISVSKIKGPGGKDVCDTKIVVIEDVQIGSMKKKAYTRISKEEVGTLLKALFNSYEFDLESVDIKDGVGTEYSDDFDERGYLAAYFNGVVVNVQRQKGMSKSYSKVD